VEIAAAAAAPVAMTTAATAAEHRCIVVVDGEQYDLTDFLSKHPGGPGLLLFSHGRDATIAVNTNHKDPARTVYPILKKYKIETQRPKEEVLKSKLGIPQFLLPESFDAATDAPSYNFDRSDESLFLNRVRKHVLARGVQQKIKHLDSLFDSVVMVLVASYLALLVAWLTGNVPWYLAVPAFALLRTALAGGGHYFLHRAGPCPGDALFDINYVGTAFTGQDGHVLLHHIYTQSEADVKRGFFGGMMGVPRLLRIPVHTLHKFGHVTTGLLVRGFQFEVDGDNLENQGVALKMRELGLSACNWRFWAVQLLLRVELVLAVWNGLFWSWLAQFALALWMNTLLVVSSHDYNEVFEEGSDDWARFQLLNTHDMCISGNPWIDCFLGAGLASHRVHHILPYQKSGFANLYSERFIAVAAKEAGLPWLPAKNLFTEIIPDIIGRQLLVAVCDPISRRQVYASFLGEHLSPAAWWYSLKYAASGFTGVGSL
jgi:hypothetical protein